MGRLLPIGMILGVPASIDNKYVAGSGVGASTISNRRAKMRAAAPKKTFIFALSISLSKVLSMALCKSFFS